MPYGDLAAQRVQRFATLDDLDRYETTIEEREEYEPHLEAGRVVYAGVDYEAILREAEPEADVILWDGGNNDFPFYRPGPLHRRRRPAAARRRAPLPPGRDNMRMADVVVINKIDSARRRRDRSVRAAIAELNPRAQIVSARSDLTLDGPPIAGKRVVVVEDGPTLTHGGMPYRRRGRRRPAVRSRALVDPRPAPSARSATSSTAIRTLEPLVPAMGYGADADRGARGDAQRGRRRHRPVGDADRPHPGSSPGQADHPRPLRARAGRRAVARRGHRAGRPDGPTGRARRVTHSTLPIRGPRTGRHPPAGSPSTAAGRRTGRPLRSGHLALAHGSDRADHREEPSGRALPEE